MFADGFCGLLGGLLAGGINSVTDRQIAVSRAEAMRDYIERHLPDPQLGFDALAQAFHASRATIFRDFAEDGGVSHYIRRRRLERAFAGLARSEGHRGLIADVARTWGFASVHTFSRQFRGAFGIRPSDVVACRAPPPPQR